MRLYHGLERIGIVNSGETVVLDASVVAKWILPGEPWEKQALELKNRFVSGGIEIHEPMLLVYELANLLLRAVNEERIGFDDAVLAMKLLDRLGLEFHETNLDKGSKLLEAAEKLNITVYDVAYISLAEEIEALLISADEEMCQKAKDIVRVKHLKDI